MLIGIVNSSTQVSDEDVYIMAGLVDKQLREHVAPAWSLAPPSVLYMPKPAEFHYDAIITVFDDADQAGDLGYHSEGPDADVYGRVFARPVLQNGGNALTNPLSVCSVLSHECIEVLGDPACDRWAQRGDATLVAIELCDPVESDSYPMTVASGKETVTGTVSDFVLPAWFDQDAAPGPTDHLGMVTAPFQVRPDGYVIEMSGGTITEQWGEEYPGWRIATKESPLSRTSRRGGLAKAEIPPTSLA